jgi:hypothetical protein
MIGVIIPAFEYFYTDPNYQLRKLVGKERAASD